MAEFLEVMKQKKRMCDTCNFSCNTCDLIKEVRNKECGNCDYYMKIYPEQAEEIIMNWAKEHQEKTNADKFKEVFGIEHPRMCVGRVTEECSEHAWCNGCKYNDFWNQEYKEPKGE